MTHQTKPSFSSKYVQHPYKHDLEIMNGLTLSITRSVYSLTDFMVVCRSIWSSSNIFFKRSLMNENFHVQISSHYTHGKRGVIWVTDFSCFSNVISARTRIYSWVYWTEVKRPHIRKQWEMEMLMHEDWAEQKFTRTCCSKIAMDSGDVGQGAKGWREWSTTIMFMST